MLNKGLIFLILLFSYTVYGVKAQKRTSYFFYFATDSSNLNGVERTKFNQFLKGLDTLAISNISITGYTDDIGRIGYNDTLSLKRAKSIKQLLMGYEINNQNINLVAGKGKLPLIRNKRIIAQRAANRRVEVIVTSSIKPSIAREKILAIDTLKIGDKIILENILFESSRHQFLPESFKTLEVLTTTLKTKSLISVAILGHICCNPPGKDIRDFDTGEFNLSQARAKAVYDYLVKNGIDSTRLSYKGLMANFPLGTGDKNDRRVELQVTGIKK